MSAPTQRPLITCHIAGEKTVQLAMLEDATTQSLKPLPWDNLPPREEDSWPLCIDCYVQYPPDWPELSWHLVHGCSGSMWGISECPGEGCLCREPLAVIQHWCEACDGEDPRTCPERTRGAIQ